MRKGQSTLGYGKTKAACLEGMKKNMSIAEVAKANGISENAVRNCSIRNNIKLRKDTNRKGWGVVKASCFEGSQNGLTPKQVAEKYDLQWESVRRTFITYKLERNEKKED
jgi:hypothetical protein